MEWFAVSVLVLLLVLGICAGKERIPDACEASTVTKPFYKMAVFLERKLSKSAGNRKFPEEIRKCVFQKNTEYIRLLDPAGNVQEKVSLQFIRKTGLCLLLLGAGMLLCLGISYSESQEHTLEDGNILLRKAYGKGRYNVALTAVIEDDKDPSLSVEETIDVEVQQREYTAKELEEMLPSFRDKLEKEVLAGNESADHVCRDLNLTEALAEYPFTVKWSYSDHSLIDHRGRLKEEIPEGGALLMLDAKIECGEFEADHDFAVMVWPREIVGEEGIREKIREALRLADENSRTSETYTLPTEADGIKIVWREEKKSSVFVLILLVMAAAAGVYLGKDKDLEKQVKERDAQMTGDYPEVVSKLALYVGAGMTVRLAWKKMASEYLKKQEQKKEETADGRKNKKISKSKERENGKRYVYEEMVFTMREMESGVSELQAYQHFAKRCRLQKYVKLVSLLEQNVKLGAKGFLESLRKESREALEERRSNAKTLGEEAGTKLLVPMMLMLAIVMVVIIVPAFMSI